MKHGAGRSILLAGIVAFALIGCATYPHQEPVEVYVADVATLAGEGLELRMLVKLRIQNPNDVPLAFDGIVLQMDVQGRPFATGVSDVSGVAPRFGETIVTVPVSLSVFGFARRAVDAVADIYRRGKLSYQLKGKLAGGPEAESVYFKSEGEFVLPAEIFGNAN